MTAGPVTEVGIVAVVPDPWSDYWQTRHHLLSRVATRFPVAWVTPPPHWRRFLAGRSARNPVPPVPGMLVHDTAGPPTAHRPRWLADAVWRRRLQTVRRRLARRGCRRFVLWLWRPEYRPALDAGPWDLTCYHLDDEYTFADEDPPIRPAERALITGVDQIFITSPGLHEKKGGLNPHTAVVPNGCDFAAYAAPSAEPASLAAIPRPRIGYTGFLKHMLDWELLSTLAARHTEWSFVLIGPRRPHPAITQPLAFLEDRPNVYLLPPQSPSVLPTYPRHFDVAIMPYRTNSHTHRYGYPLKLHEYLAAGCPVVSYPMRTLREFADVVLTADGVEAWSDALATAVRQPDAAPGDRVGRQTVARQHDWGIIANRVVEILETRLRKKAKTGDGP